MSTIGEGIPEGPILSFEASVRLMPITASQKAAIFRRKVVVALVALKNRTPRRTKCHLLHHPSLRTIQNAA